MEHEEFLAALLIDVKRHLCITWEDEATDSRIRGYIAGGIAYLDGKRGEPADYTQYGLPRTLLMEYVRYARDCALDVYEANYRALILAMQNERRVAAYDAAESAI